MPPTRAANNAFGHIIEMTPPDGDHAADSLRLGHPGPLRRPHDRRSGRAVEPRRPRPDGWFACPDNAAVDAQGRLWIATDQGDNWARTGQRRRALRAGDRGPAAAAPSKLFFRVPGRRGDVRPLLHARPGDVVPRGAASRRRRHRRLQRLRPAVDLRGPGHPLAGFRATMPPRPSVLAITKRGGGKIA